LIQTIVWKFLAACKSELGMSFEDLFSVSDCFSDDEVKQKKVEIFVFRINEIKKF